VLYGVVFVKKGIMVAGSYIVVAMLASLVTLASVVRFGVGGTKLEQLEQLIVERFVGGVEQEALEDAAAKAMVAATGDRWSYYIPASEYGSYQEQMENAYVGVGITIEQGDGGFRIREVTDGSGAGEAGLLVDDLLIRVGEQDVTHSSMEDVGALVRGEEGSFVSLTVLREGTERTFSVERRRVLRPVATYALLEDNVGLITIENFDERCAEETIAAIEALLEQGMEKLIFDVRFNPGGYADEMVKVLDRLLPEGELFRTVGYDGKEKVDYSDETCLEIPMAVLVNGESYSAAEFFAEALREYDAAIVVGEKTCGKGYYQNNFRLADGSAVSLSVGRYFTPQGGSLADVGVTPDVAVEVDAQTEAEIYYGTLPADQDPQLQAALEALQ